MENVNQTIVSDKSITIDNDIASLIMEDLSKDTLMAIEDAFNAGAKQAYNDSSKASKGHLANLMGQNRHFFMNETFHAALTSSSVRVNPLAGNSIVVGEVGKLRLVRMNIPQGRWEQARKSRLRKELVKTNKMLLDCYQVNLFEENTSIECQYENIESLAVFFIAYFNGYISEDAKTPYSIEIVVPDHQCRTLLFRENINSFQERYNVAAIEQEDKAFPKLKEKIAKKGTNNEF